MINFICTKKFILFHRVALNAIRNRRIRQIQTKRVKKINIFDYFNASEMIRRVSDITTSSLKNHPLSSHWGKFSFELSARTFIALRYSEGVRFS